MLPASIVPGAGGRAKKNPGRTAGVFAGQLLAAYWPVCAAARVGATSNGMPGPIVLVSVMLFT